MLRRMLKIEIILTIMVAFLSVGVVNVYASQNYKKLYFKTIKTNDGIRHMIKVTKEKLKKMHYEKNAHAKAIMKDVNDQIHYANQVRAKAEKLAKEGKYKKAYLWAYQEFQYLVKAVVKLNVIKNLLTSQE